MGRVGVRVKRDRIYEYLWLIYIVRQKPTQHCKAIILQFKEKKILREEKTEVLLVGKKVLVLLSGLIHPYR